MVLSLSVLILGYFINDTFLKFNGSDVKQENEISLLSFNLNGFSGYYAIDNPNVEKDIVDFVNTQNADIVCFQEFNRKMYSEFINYPYRYQTPYSSGSTMQAIFSKYPLISCGSLDFKNTINNALYADVLIKKDTVRLYNLHLQSFRVRPAALKNEAPTNIFNRMNLAFQKQLDQAELVKSHSSNTSHKKIICGDFNSTQFSNVYDNIKGDLKDTFLEQGIGFGNTYYFKFLPFRIDYVLTDLKITSHKNFDILLSDHKPIMASFQLSD